MRKKTSPIWHPFTQHALQPDMVKVDFDVVGGGVAFEVTVPKLLFTSQERATGELDATIGFHGNKVTVGVVSGEHVAQAFAAIRKAGTVVVTAIGPMADVGIPVSLLELTLSQKRIQGSLFGACNPTADIPRQVQMYREGQLKLDELITTTYALDEVSKGYEDMHAGTNIRGVILYDS